MKIKTYLKKILFPLLLILPLLGIGVAFLWVVKSNAGSVTKNDPQATHSDAKLIQTVKLDQSSTNKLNYPRIANLWGLTSNPDFFVLVNQYDLAIPYSYKNKPLTILGNVTKDANTKILFTQYSTKGRSDLDSQINEWWNSPLGTPGYACLLRDSHGNILLSSGWNVPRVNMLDSYCRNAVLEKNVNAYLAAVNTKTNTYLYDGIYWDEFFGRISWLSDDIDSNLDGVADDPVELDANYKAAVIDFLQQLRMRLPGILLVGNESPIEFAKYMNGRVFEWQLQSYMDGSKLHTWDEIIQDYIQWTNQSLIPHDTILMNAPEEALIEKYGFNNLDKIPSALMQETEASYQRMRFGLTSALLGDGLYSFDFGKMIHGQFWWYDEYGRITEGSQQNAATLPLPGYLGSPLEEPFRMASIHIGHGIVSLDNRLIANPISYENAIEGVVTGQNLLTGSLFSNQAWNSTFSALINNLRSIFLSDSQTVTDVWARRYEHGMVLVNTGNQESEVKLTSTYCKLNGQQAPLFSVRVDDDQAKVTGSWQVSNASFNQFGSTVHTADPGSDGMITYVPRLAYEGNYEVLVWVNPTAEQSHQVTYTITHALGKSTVTLDGTSGSVGWHSLGVFTFHSGNKGKVSINGSLDGFVVADALKWESVARYNDGSRVTSVTLQPNDGIILVDCDVNP